jgi:hypothetical protein
MSGLHATVKSEAIACARRCWSSRLTGGRQEKNNRKNGGPRRRRGTRGPWTPKILCANGTILRENKWNREAPSSLPTPGDLFFIKTALFKKTEKRVCFVYLSLFCLYHDRESRNQKNEMAGDDVTRVAQRVFAETQNDVEAAWNKSRQKTSDAGFFSNEFALRNYGS